MTKQFVRLLRKDLALCICLGIWVCSLSVLANDNVQEKLPISYMENFSELRAGQVYQFEEQRNKKTFQVAKVLIKASPEAVFKVFTDYKAAPAIFSNLKQCRIVSSTSHSKQVWFEAAAGGGLFKFEYVLEFTEHAPNLIEWHRVSGAFKINEGDWRFDSVQDGKSTLVTYSKYVEAGFPIPQFVVKKELKDNMPVILTELKKRVEKSG